MSLSIYPVILAGGASSRLWPASGRERPKWDLRLFGRQHSAGASKGQPQSLLEGAWERARGVAPASDCFVVAGAAQAELIRLSLPELPAANLLIEPEPRDTAGAVAYASAAILRRGSANKGADQVMFVLPGDHVIAQLERFKRCALTAAQAACQLQALMTFGIVAKTPATAYGYIHRGEKVFVADAAGDAPAVFKVKQFREKPDRPTAEQYVSSGEYYWNGGIFMWQMSTLMNEFKSQLPGHAAMIDALTAVPGGAAATGGAEWQTAARKHFPELKKTSIDFGIMEHAKTVATVTADFDWDDIGSWSAVAAHLESSNGNAIGPSTQVLPLDSKGNLVFAPGKRIALIGVDGLAVVQSGDDILICRLDRDQDVKKISEMAKPPLSP
jgi:mannose-1-phosphate guanylyltransferase